MSCTVWLGAIKINTRSAQVRRASTQTSELRKRKNPAARKLSTHQDAGTAETSLGLWHPSGCCGWHSSFSCKSLHEIRGCYYRDTGKKVLCHQLAILRNSKPLHLDTSLFGWRACTSSHHRNRCYATILIGKVDSSMRLVWTSAHRTLRVSNDPTSSIPFLSCTGMLTVMTSSLDSWSSVNAGSVRRSELVE